MINRDYKVRVECVNRKIKDKDASEPFGMEKTFYGDDAWEKAKAHTKNRIELFGDSLYYRIVECQKEKITGDWRKTIVPVNW